MKEAEIHLPYYKQGDDLGGCLQELGNVNDALEAHALQLEDAAAILRKIKEIVKDKKVEIDADTHSIIIIADDEVIDALIAAELASIPDWMDEDEDEEEQDESDFTKRDLKEME